MNQSLASTMVFFSEGCGGDCVQPDCRPGIDGKTPDEAAIAAAMPMARTCIDELDRLLGSQSFLAGDRLSIADLMLAPQVDFLQATREGKSLLDGTRLAGWLARMNQRPSMQRTQRPANLQAAA